MNRLSSRLRSLRRVQGYRRDFSYVFATNLTLMALGLLTGSLTARLLGPAGRGELAAIQLWGMLLISLGSLGVPEALVYFTGREPAKTGQLISSAWAVMLPLSFFWIGIGFWFLPLLLHNYSEETVRYAQLFLLILPLAYIARANMANLGIKNFRSWGLFRLHKPVIYTFLLVILGLLGQATPYSLTVALVFSSIFGPILVIYMIRKSTIKLTVPDWTQMRELLSFGYRSVLGTVPDQLNARLDQFVMVLWLTSSELGLYVAAVSWSLMLGPIVRTISTVTFPYVAGGKTKLGQLEIFSRSSRISVSIIFSANFLLMIVTPIFLPLLYGREFQAAVGAALLLLIASSFYSLKQVLSGGLRGLGYPEATAFAEISSLAATGVLLLLLLPPLGIIGAAIASLLAYFLAVVVLLAFTLRKVPLTLRSMLLLDAQDIALLKRSLSPKQVAEV